MGPIRSLLGHVEAMIALRLYALAYPVVLPLAFLGTWVAGRLQLGYWPRPSLDDPKSIGLWVDVPYLWTMALLVIGLPLFAGAVLGLLGQAWVDRARRVNCLVCGGLALVGLVAAVSWLRWDPLGVVNWYMD